MWAPAVEGVARQGDWLRGATRWGAQKAGNAGAPHSLCLLPKRHPRCTHLVTHGPAVKIDGVVELRQDSQSQAVNCKRAGSIHSTSGGSFRTCKNHARPARLLHVRLEQGHSLVAGEVQEHGGPGPGLHVMIGGQQAAATTSAPPPRCTAGMGTPWHASARGTEAPPRLQGAFLAQQRTAVGILHQGLASQGLLVESVIGVQLQNRNSRTVGSGRVSV